MYICTKAMTLNGDSYLPGDPVPENAFQPGRADKLMSYGYISKSEAILSKSEEKRIELQMEEPAEEAEQEIEHELNAEPEPVQVADVIPEESEEKPKKKKSTKKEE